MTLPITPALVEYLAARHFVETSLCREIRHSDGNWTVLLRFEVSRVRYFAVRSELRTRSVNIIEMDPDSCFTFWTSDEDELDRMLGRLPTYVARTESTVSE